MSKHISKTPDENLAFKVEEGDLIDRLIADWVLECPEFDTSAMAIVGRIILLAQRYESAANDALKDFGLRYTEFDILATLRRTGGSHTLTPTELCSVVLLTSGAMTAALDRLEAMDLIDRVADRQDRRVKAARLTAKGVQLAEKAAQQRFNIADEAVSHMTDAQQGALSKLLRKLTLGLEN